MTDNVETTTAESRKHLDSQLGDQRERTIAVVLGWLIPGAGHLYQGRIAKGLLFMFCILGTFYYGVALGSDRTVYMGFKRANPRAFFYSPPQMFVGLPCLPALIQGLYMGPGKAPLWNGYMAPPLNVGDEVPLDWAIAQEELGPEKGDFRVGDFKRSVNPGYAIYSDPHNNGPVALQTLAYEPGAIKAIPQYEQLRNQYSVWNSKYDYKYDLGTLFTMVAGLLNLMVLFDAWGGPGLGINIAEYQSKVKQVKALLEQDAAEKKAAKTAAKPN
jgi:hypothetical protein